MPLLCDPEQVTSPSVPSLDIRKKGTLGELACRQQERLQACATPAQPGLHAPWLRASSLLGQHHLLFGFDVIIFQKVTQSW